MKPILTHETDSYRLSWYRLGETLFGKHDPDDPNSIELLSLGAERREADRWAPLTDSPMLTVMPAKAPAPCLRGALEYFAEVLETVPPENAQAALDTLAWTNLADRDVLQAALRHVDGNSLVEFFSLLVQVDPLAAPKALKMVSDDLLAMLTQEHCVKLVQNATGNEQKAAAIRMLTENAHRIPALRKGRTR